MQHLLQLGWIRNLLGDIYLVAMVLLLQACHNSLERSADWLFSHADDLDAAVASVSGEPASQSAAPAGKQFVHASMNPVHASLYVLRCETVHCCILACTATYKNPLTPHDGNDRLLNSLLYNLPCVANLVCGGCLLVSANVESHSRASSVQTPVCCNL